MTTSPAPSRPAAIRLCRVLVAICVCRGAVGCDAEPEPKGAPAASPAPVATSKPATRAEPVPSSGPARTGVAAAPAASPAAPIPSHDVPPGEPSPGSVARESPRAAAEFLLAALRRRDAVAMAQVVAPGKEGTAEHRVAQTLDGKGKLRSLAAALRDGVRLAPGREVPSRPEDGREVVKILLDLTDADGTNYADAAALEVFKFEDGWRVDDFDRTGGNWPK